jgi:hypothetical protein
MEPGNSPGLLYKRYSLFQSSLGSISLISLLIQLIHKGLLNSIESRFQDDSIALIIPPQVRSYEVKQEFHSEVLCSGNDRLTAPYVCMEYDECRYYADAKSSIQLRRFNSANLDF